MKNSKKGISLIVLVITIIVIIILAAAVLLSLQNNNPIQNANDARKANDLSEAQSAVTLYLSNYMAKNDGADPLKAKFTASTTTYTFGSTDDASTPGVKSLGLDGTLKSVTVNSDYKVTQVVTKTGTTLE